MPFYDTFRCSSLLPAKNWDTASASYILDPRPKLKNFWKCKIRRQFLDVIKYHDTFTLDISFQIKSKSLTQTVKSNYCNSKVMNCSWTYPNHNMSEALCMIEMKVLSLTLMLSRSFQNILDNSRSTLGAWTSLQENTNNPYVLLFKICRPDYWPLAHHSISRL